MGVGWCSGDSKPLSFCYDKWVPHVSILKDYAVVHILEDELNVKVA